MRTPCLAAAALAAAPTLAASYKPLFAIPGHADSAAPAAALIAVNGAWYGTAASGGTANAGTVFKLDPATGQETVLHSFTGRGSDGATPLAPLIADDGALYGTTQAGGTAGSGTVFSVDPTTGAVATLCSLPGFPGDAAPLGALLPVGGFLYGTSAAGGRLESGTIFKVDPVTGAETSVWTFGATLADGAFPQAGLTAIGTILYGTTLQGGASLAGTIFRFDTATNTETPVFNFTGAGGLGFPAAPLLAVSGGLYGTTSAAAGGSSHGSVFRFDPAANTLAVLHAFTGGADGSDPRAGLIEAGGLLFGTTTGQGGGGGGTVFKIAPAGSGTETPLYAFTGGYDGGMPFSGLLATSTGLCGTAEAGGYANSGVAFCVNPTTKTETVLTQFAGVPTSVGATPVAVGNTLYAVASAGGAHGYGAIVAFDRATGAGRIAYDFAGGPDGTYPQAALVAAGDALYGATRLGGAHNLGTLFEFDPATAKKTTVHDFAGADGAQPVGGLTAAGTGLYGTTYSGGAANDGTVYRFFPATNQLATLYSFQGGADGYLPWASLTLFGNLLYGTTLNGGTGHNGTLYAIDPGTGQHTTLYRFAGRQDGSSPFAPLLAANNRLYGVTSGFGTPLTSGTIFAFDPASRTEQPLFHFNDKTGDMPLGGVAAIGQTLYGAATFAGRLGLGTLYSFDAKTGIARTLHDFSGGLDGALPQSSLVQQGHSLYGATGSGSATLAGTLFKLHP